MTETPPGHLLCLGFGYSARAIAAALTTKGWRVSGTTRSPDKAFALDDTTVRPLVWQAPAPLTGSMLDGVSHLLISVAPDEWGCPALAAFEDSELPDSLKAVVYLSSTGIYGDHDGAWVTEDSALVPATARGRARLKAETGWADHAAAHGLDFMALRLAGIYGPGRNALESLIARERGGEKGLAQRIYKPGQVFSRLHVADIAAAATALLTRPAWPEDIALNLADDLPAPPQDVIEYAAYLLGLAPPPLVTLEEAALSPMARSFYADNKRISAQRARDVLGWAPAFPSYRAGLSALLKTLPRAGTQST